MTGHISGLVQGFQLHPFQIASSPPPNVTAFMTRQKELAVTVTRDSARRPQHFKRPKTSRVLVTLLMLS